MTLIDTRLKQRLSRKGILIGIIIALSGIVFGNIVPIYGWLLSAIFVILGFIVSIYIPKQKNELEKTFTISHKTDAILVKRGDANKRKH
ncbi:hypothetical protein ACFLQ6_00160 [Thermoproteota archaeon]